MNDEYNACFPDNLNKRIVKAFFTTKKIGDDEKKISTVISVAHPSIYMPIQRHTSRVQILRYDSDRKVADAVLTRKQNVLIGVKVADCVPVLIYDPVRLVCGAVHAGWRGTAAGIMTRTIRTMVQEFYSKPSDVLLAIGPSIRWCCYSVGLEVIDAVSKASGRGTYHMKKGNKRCLDLPMANQIQALHAGIREENIWTSEECTYCNTLKYYSYRSSKWLMGRQGGFIGIFT